MTYSAAHWRRVSEETRRMVAEVPLYRDRPAPPADPATVDRWLAEIPPVGKRELRRGFPKALLRKDQDLHIAMQNEQVTLLATSGTTADRLQVIWEWSWWEPQEREAGVLFMECEHGRLHPNERHSHVDLVPMPGRARLARVLVTTLGRRWMPLLRYEIGDVVRVAESRDCACGLKSDGPLLERVEG